MFFFFFRWWRDLQQIQRAAVEPPPHIVRHLGAGFSGSPHLRHRYRPLRDNIQVILFLQILISTMCVYIRHTPAERFNSRCCENLGIRPELKIFPWRKGRVYMEHIHQFCLPPIFYSTPNFCLRAAVKFQISQYQLEFFTTLFIRLADWSINTCYKYIQRVVCTLCLKPLTHIKKIAILI